MHAWGSARKQSSRRRATPELRSPVRTQRARGQGDVPLVSDSRRTSTENRSAYNLSRGIRLLGAGVSRRGLAGNHANAQNSQTQIEIQI